MKNLLRTGLLLAIILIAGPKIYAQVSIDVSIQSNVAPPEIPEYDQPPCPDDGYLWQPGYWAWDPDAQDYYWVPGVWVAPPEPGYLWTPCYWDYESSVYVYHPGYWGRHVGFYGGINYGGGFFGIGFSGGEWQGDRFRYNTAVVNVNTTVIHNTYVDRTVINNNTIVNNRVSYNGGNGVKDRPRPEEEQAMREQHVPPTSQQAVHQQAAHSDRSQFVKVNNGRPATVAMNKVNGERVPPKGAANNQPANDNRGRQMNKPPADPAPANPAVQPQRDQQHAQPQNVQPQRDRQHAQPQNVQPQQQPVQPQRDLQHAQPPTVQPPQDQQHAQPQPVQPQQQPVQPQRDQQHAQPPPVQPQQHAQPQTVQPQQQPVQPQQQKAQPQRVQQQRTQQRTKSHDNHRAPAKPPQKNQN